jgi:hypothetical protein
MKRVIKEIPNWIMAIMSIGSLVLGVLAYSKTEKLKKNEQIINYNDFRADASLYIYEDIIHFVDQGDFWSKKSIIDFSKKDVYTINFDYKPTKKMSIKYEKRMSKLNVWFSIKNEIKEKIPYWKSLKSPIFIDFDTDLNRTIQIEITEEIGSSNIIGKANKLIVSEYILGEWNRIKIIINKGGNITVYMNNKYIVNVSSDKRDVLKKYFLNNIKLYIGFQSWTDAPLGIKNIIIN